VVQPHELLPGDLGLARAVSGLCPLEVVAPPPAALESTGERQAKARYQAKFANKFADETNGAKPETNLDDRLKRLN
jgi:hypothetical protein